MRQFFTAATLAALAFAASSLGLAKSAEAGTIEVTNNTDTFTGLYGGGEIAVAQYSGSPGYASLGTGVQVSPWLFQTFCVEVNENLQYGTLLNFTASDSAVQGGTGGGSPDPLSAATAWLFTQFWNGVLEGYDYDTTGDRTDSATALQLAIWQLEDEIDGNSALESHYDGNSVAQGWVSDALSAGWDDIGDVMVLNLTNNDGGHLQSLLVVTPIPLPPAALLGLGLLGGVGGLGLLRRRARRTLV
jgi:hypothetical protein